MNPDVKAIETRIRDQAAKDWADYLEATVKPLRDNLPKFTINLNGKELDGEEIFKAMVDEVYKVNLPQKQDLAIAKFLEDVAKMK